MSAGLLCVPLLQVRRMQEQKYRRQNGLDGLPAWLPADEEAYSTLAAREITGLCLCAVKQ